MSFRLVTYGRTVVPPVLCGHSGTYFRMRSWWSCPQPAGANAVGAILTTSTTVVFFCGNDWKAHQMSVYIPDAHMPECSCQRWGRSENLHTPLDKMQGRHRDPLIPGGPHEAPRIFIATSSDQCLCLLEGQATDWQGSARSPSKQRVCCKCRARRDGVQSPSHK